MDEGTAGSQSWAANLGGKSGIPLQDTLLEGAGEVACLMAWAQLLWGQSPPQEALVPVCRGKAARVGGGLD